MLGFVACGETESDEELLTEAVAADGERDRFFSAQEALEYGLVDEVAEFPAAKAGDTNDKSDG